MSNTFKYLANETDDDDIGKEEEEEDIVTPQESTEEAEPVKSEEKTLGDLNSNQNQPENDKKEEVQNEEETTNPDRLTPEQIKNCPTVFQALGMSENRRVLYTFLGISLSLVVVGFGSFYLGKKFIPVIFKSIDPFDAPIYSCGLAVVLTQIIVFTFFFWAWHHDVAQEKKEKEIEEMLKKEKRLKNKLKQD